MGNYEKIVQIIPNGNPKLMVIYSCVNEDENIIEEIHLPVLCFALIEYENEHYGLQQKVVPMVMFECELELEICGDVTNGFLRTEIVSDDCEV